MKHINSGIALLSIDGAAAFEQFAPGDGIVKLGLFQKRQDPHGITGAAPMIPEGVAVIQTLVNGGRKPVVYVMIIVQSQTDLLEVVFAGGPAGRFASLLHRRQQQSHKYRDNRDNHEEFNQREARPGMGGELGHGNSFKNMNMHYSAQESTTHSER